MINAEIIKNFDLNSTEALKVLGDAFTMVARDHGNKAIIKMTMNVKEAFDAGTFSHDQALTLMNLINDASIASKK